MKIHSSRPVGWVDTASWAERTRCKAAGGQTQRSGGVCVCGWVGGGVGGHKAAAGRWDSSWWTKWQTTQPRVPAWGNQASNHWLKTPVGVEAAAGDTPSLTGEFVGETQGPRTYTNPSTQEAAPEGPDLTVGSRGSDWKPAESRTSTNAPYQPLPHRLQCHSAALSITLPWWIPKAPPPLCNRGAKTKKKWPKWKNRTKLQKKYN